MIGDSHVETFQVDADKSYPSLMRSKLGDRYDVYSFGMSGAPLSEYLNMSRYVRQHCDPDIFIFNVVYNDFLESVNELNPNDTYQLTVSVRDSVIKEIAPRPDYSFAQYNAKKRLLRKSAIVRYIVYNLKIPELVTMFSSKRSYSANVDVDAAENHRDVIKQAANHIVGRIKEENSAKRIIFVMSTSNQDIYAGTGTNTVIGSSATRSSPLDFLDDIT